MLVAIFCLTVTEAMTTSIMDLIFQLKNKCALKTEEFQEQMHILPSEYAALTCIDARAPLSLAQFSGAVGLSTSRAFFS